MSSHAIRGRQLSRDTEHRAALRRNMVQSLFEHGKIRTTLPRAKEVRGFAEKLSGDFRRAVVARYRTAEWQAQRQPRSVAATVAM